MNPRHRDIAQSLSLSALLLVVSAMAIWVWYTQHPSQPPKKTVEQAQADTALSYIKTLAAYQALGAPSAILKKLELAQPGLWVAQFQTQPKGSVVEHYYLEIQDNRVIHHDITVMDAAQSLFVYSPEPEEIIGKSAVVVKGKAKPGEQVTISLHRSNESQADQTVYTNADASTGDFVHEFTNVESGSFDLTVDSASASLILPIIVQTDL